MLQKLRGNNQKGFTLIELMIVIAIIGILAAIAIPNFIAYRNKSFCSQAESDANSVASSLANYFSIPTRTAMPYSANETGRTDYLGIEMSGSNELEVVSADPNVNITIGVLDGSGRCPQEYMDASDKWEAVTANTYYITMTGE